MRILNIINNELILRKQKLESELERLLNEPTISTDEKVEKSIEMVDKLSITDSSIKTWELYTKQKTEK
jgi:hypothetical protein|tara:strand:- start:1853 stop:2056 length:204 start_codon:yes stop_codon:yes gene_type:complete